MIYTRFGIGPVTFIRTLGYDDDIPLIEIERPLGERQVLGLWDLKADGGATEIEAAYNALQAAEEQAAEAQISLTLTQADYAVILEVVQRTLDLVGMNVNRYSVGLMAGKHPTRLQTYRAQQVRLTQVLAKLTAK